MLTAARRCGLRRCLRMVEATRPRQQCSRRLSSTQGPPPAEPGPPPPPFGPYSKEGAQEAAAEAAAAEAAARPEPPVDPASLGLEPQNVNMLRVAGIVFGLFSGYMGAKWLDINVLPEKAGDNALFRGPSPTSTFSTTASLTNWSGTHSVEPVRYYEPQTAAELEALVKDAHERGIKIRPVGTGLSPNGVAMCKEGMVSLSQLDKILHVDEQARTVTVQAGARVSQVLEALAPYGLTLENFSSIQEQQMGGWTQVAAHGTGASLPTVEEQIVSLKIVTPTVGVLELSDPDDARFKLAKVSVGTLGVVSEMTLKCVPKHRLLEHTYTTTPKQLRKDHARLLREYRHVRYMWLPYTDKVVVVVSNPYQDGDPLPRDFDKRVPEEKKLQAARQLLLKAGGLSKEAVQGLSFTELRDHLLHLAPLDSKHVSKVNEAEAQYWSLSKGWRLDDSTRILGFDCGGQQWVLEVAFPIGSLETLSKPGQELRDIDFVQKVLARIKERNLPAPCPIEQRWTSSSRAYISPAFSEKEDEVFTWVGIIMYLPPEGDPNREAVTQQFDQYVQALEPLYEEYGAVPHWAKIELPSDRERLSRLRRRLYDYYPFLDGLSEMRDLLDPKHILSNPLMDAILKRPPASTPTPPAAEAGKKA